MKFKVIDEGFTSLRFKINSSIDFDSSKYQTNSICDDNSSASCQQTEHTGKSPKSKKSKKIFLRRKDVIIKTLLRKGRKFFIQDFNSKMNYMKQKRKQTNKIYVTLLKNYLSSVMDVKDNDRVTAFLGAYLYQKDLEENIDQIASSNLLASEIEDTSDKISQILYKYSHQKFRAFSKTSEFLPIFMHFYKYGANNLKNDPEYSAGLEIIKDQLQSSLQDC